MATGLSTMSLMKVTGGMSRGGSNSASTTPYNSPVKELSSSGGVEGSARASKAKTTSVKKGGSKKGNLLESERRDATTPKPKSGGSGGDSEAGGKPFGKAKSNLLSRLTASESTKFKSSRSEGSLATATGEELLHFHCPPQKKGGVVLDLIVECDVNTLWNLFAEDDTASQLWRRFIKQRKYEEVTMEPWSDEDSTEGQRRERKFEYITGFKSHFIRGKHKTYETHTVTRSMEGKVYVLESKTTVPTLPVGDSMYTLIQYCFVSRSKQSSFLQATYEIVYTKRTSLKSIIEKSSAGGIKESMKDIRAALKTIVKVRDAPKHRIERKAKVSRATTSKIDTMVTHGVFRFLMQYPHAILALLCSLYLLLDRIYLSSSSSSLQTNTFPANSKPSLGGITTSYLESDETCDRVDLRMNDAMKANASTKAEFCSHALIFWLLGYLFKFLVLASHWIITNLPILLIPLFSLCRCVCESSVVRKVSQPIKRTVTAVLQSLEIRRTEIIRTTSVPEGVGEDEGGDNSIGSVVPAAAEAAMVVSKIAQFSGLSPAAQAEAVRGLRDRKQAQLVNNVTKTNNKGDESGLYVEEVFENQRYQPFRGWGSSWPGHLLPTDCGRWSNRIGLPKVGAQSQMFECVAPALPPNWVWLETEWQIDLSGLKETRVDKDGFYYGVMAFSGLKDFPPSPGSGKKNMKQFIRRRRWSRTRIHSVKIRDVLMGKNLDLNVDGKDGSSLKQKIETLLGWRKSNKKYEANAPMEEPFPHLRAGAPDVGKTSKSAPVSTGARRRSLEVSDGDVVLEEVFEQEQRLGSHQEWTDPINSKNLKRWSCRDGSASSAAFSEAAPQLPPGFKWVGHWNIDNSTEYSEMVDDDGWSYANTFWPILISGDGDTDFPTGSKTNTAKDKARRRRWIRHRRRITENEEALAASMPEMEDGDLLHEPKNPHSHSSKQLDALDLPPSPSESEHRTKHKRNASEQLLEVLDLSAPLTQRGEAGEDGEEEECSTPKFNSNAQNLFREGSGPLSEGLQRLPLSPGPDRKDWDADDVTQGNNPLVEPPPPRLVSGVAGNTPEREAAAALIDPTLTMSEEEADTSGDKPSLKEEVEEFYEIDPGQEGTTGKVTPEEENAGDEKGGGGSC